MRSLAKSLGIRASSLYGYFPDREALLIALADEVTRRLHAELQGAAQGLLPGEAVMAVAHAYVDFAREHGNLYDLIANAREPLQPSSGPGKELWNFLLAQVGSITHRQDDTASAVALWSLLHGFVSLERMGLFGASGPRGGLEVGLDAMLRGFGQVTQDT